MGWQGSLRLAYRPSASPVEGATARTVLRSRHDGPLRVLASLYPETPQVCHNVLVHPPGGLVGGDTLTIDVQVASDAHALITTPGATRYYRSTGQVAAQQVDARIDTGGRLEWLPLETIAYSGCLAANTMRFELAPGAEMIGWDVLALGLPASGQPFGAGRYLQSIDLPGRWLERGIVDATDALLLDSPLGWAGRRALGTLWFAGGAAVAGARRDALVDAARAAIDADVALAASAGATAVDEAVIVVRVLAPRVEPAIALLTRVWAAWRRLAWQLDATPPRVWRT